MGRHGIPLTRRGLLADNLRLRQKANKQATELRNLTCALTKALLAMARAQAAQDAANAKAVRVDEAERRAAAAEQQAQDMYGELLQLRQFKANACSVSPLPQHTSTQPTDTTELRWRYENGTPRRLGAGHRPGWAHQEGAA